MLYKPYPQLYIAAWLSQNSHPENKVQRVLGMNIDVHVISTKVDIPVCASLEDIQVATSQDPDLQRLKSCII